MARCLDGIFDGNAKKKRHKEYVMNDALAEIASVSQVHMAMHYIHACMQDDRKRKRFPVSVNGRYGGRSQCKLRNIRIYQEKNFIQKKNHQEKNSITKNVLQ